MNKNNVTIIYGVLTGIIASIVLQLDQNSLLLIVITLLALMLVKKKT